MYYLNLAAQCRGVLVCIALLLPGLLHSNATGCDEIRTNIHQTQTSAACNAVPPSNKTTSQTATVQTIAVTNDGA